MPSQSKLTVSHAPFLHNGSSVAERTYHMILAALPAVFVGLVQYGMPAVGVVCLSVSTAILWELGINIIRKQPKTAGDGNAALIGLLFAMLIPATTPWWVVIIGTFIAVVIGKQIYGGIGGNAFNPVLLSLAILMVSWSDTFDFGEALLDYDFDFAAAYPLAQLKHFGVAKIDAYSGIDLLLGRQTGGIGATFGLGLLIGGVYLMAMRVIRWEISLSFLAGLFVTALIFNVADSERYAGPIFHLLTGYSLIGAFFLATDDSSSPVNFIPMLLYGAGAGVMTILIRNVGVYVDGVVFAILLMNLVNPILDKIRPKAMGKVV